jgi:glycosyltransferase involved in cell wall biosynthesis
MPGPDLTAAERSLGIVHAVAPGRMGGLESVVRALASGQHHRGHRVLVACVADSPTADLPLADALDAAGVATRRLVVPPRRYFSEWRQWRQVLKQWQPDVVHTHGYRPDVVAGAAARGLGLAAVTTVHGFTGGGRKNRTYEWLQRRAFRRFDAVIAVSGPLVGHLAEQGILRDRLHLVRNAWSGGAPPLSRAEARQAFDLPRNQVVLGWVGRLGHEKAADGLVRALPLMRRSEAHACFVGDGRERPALEALAAKLGVTPRVRWAGPVADAARYYRAFDAFVLSSRTEGTPIALFEAIAADVPVVVTRVGGVPDVVSPAEALLVPPDDPAAMAAALDAALNDPVAARARAAAARARLTTEFDPAIWLDRHDAVYAAALQSAHRKRT